MTDMSKQTEALKLALEALEWINRVNAMEYEYQQKARESLNAIYEALAEQPAHQHIEHCLWARNGNQPCPHVQPAQRTWVGLTDKEIVTLFNKTLDGKFLDVNSMTNFAHAIEAKLREKNGIKGDA